MASWVGMLEQIAISAIASNFDVRGRAGGSEGGAAGNSRSGGAASGTGRDVWTEGFRRRIGLVHGCIAQYGPASLDSMAVLDRVKTTG